MASRILFEDDILDPEVNKIDQLQSNEETMVKKDPANDDIYSSNESQDSMMDITTKSIITENVIYLGSKVNKENDISNEQNGNNSQDDGKTPQDESKMFQEEGKKAEVFEVTVTPVMVDKAKGKRRIKSELELLLLDIKKDEEDLDREYDVFGDNNTIFRKYKLRKIQQT